VLLSLESVISISVTTAVGALVFKEKITVKKLAGIFIGLVAVLLINI
jgi:drug/metabolite transporter (DMT)-like permease